MHLAFSRKFARYLRGLQSHISNQFSQICATTADLLDLGEFDDAMMLGTQQDNALSLSQLRRLLKNCTLDPKSSHWISRIQIYLQFGTSLITDECMVFGPAALKGTDVRSYSLQ